MRNKKAFLLLISISIVLSATTAGAETTVSYLYTLSNFNGPIRYNWARMSVDHSTGELYVLYQNSVKIFSGTGMEVYEFGDDLEVGGMFDIAVGEESNIFLLTGRGRDDYSIVRCDYRGKPMATFRISGLPNDFAMFVPDRIAYAKGNLYFLAQGRMTLVVADPSGNFRAGFDIKSHLAIDEKQKKEDMDISGFSVDREGNIFFGIPVLFSVFKLTPDWQLSSFGQAGNLPGKFNLISGVATDSRGRYLVADILRSTVSVFDTDYKFLLEFGHRGVHRESLFAPSDIVLDDSGKLYVTQARSKGISVFRLAYEQQ